MGESVVNSLAGKKNRVNALSRNYGRNMAYANPSENGYQTALPPQDEMAFREWVNQNKVPFDPSEPVQDYDMRGFWQGMQNNDEHARSGMNANDGLIHYSDWWKTPYHGSFSRDSQWATPMAPSWNDRDQLVMPINGAVVYDERKANRRK